MIRVKTQSGSVYEIDDAGKRIRTEIKGNKNQHRISFEWKSYQSITLEHGKPLWVYWGTGADENSPTDIIPANDPRWEGNMRMTYTSPVVSVERYGLEAA